MRCRKCVGVPLYRVSRYAGKDLRPRERQKTQREPEEPGVVVVEPEPQMAPDQPRSRSGRTIKKPAYHGEK